MLRTRIQRLLMLFLVAGSAIAAGDGPTGIPIAVSVGLDAFSGHRFGDAAEAWHALAVRASLKPLDRALIYVLAAIAYERAGSRDALAEWSTANRMYSVRDTSWIFQRQFLTNQLSAIRTKFRAPPLQWGAVETGFSGSEALLIAIESATSVTQYDGPQLEGVADRGEQRITPAASEYPSALSVPIGMPESNARRLGLPGGRVLPGGMPKDLDTALTSALDLTENDWVNPIVAAGSGGLRPVPHPTGLTDDASDVVDSRAAWTAWHYVETQWDTATGLCPAGSDDYRVTPWHLGSCLASMVAADKLGMLTHDTFRTHIDLFLKTLGNLVLSHDQLPNAFYDSRSAERVDASGRPSDDDLRPAAVDIGRLVTWLSITARWYPEYREPTSRLLRGWNLGLAASTLTSARPERAEDAFLYGRYGLLGLNLVLPLRQNIPPSRTMLSQSWQGIDIPLETDAGAVLASEPLLLATFEHGVSGNAWSLIADRLRQVHKLMTRLHGAPACSGELTLPDQRGFALLAAGWRGGLFALFQADGQLLKDDLLFATGSAYGWAVLDNDPSLREVAMTLQNHGNGFHSGRRSDGTTIASVDLDTQAMVLEALLYQSRKRESFLTSEE